MHMKTHLLALFMAGALVGCTAAPLPDTAIMPTTGAGTPIMSDQGAIGLSAYVLGERSRVDGHPADAARALAAIEYLAGALYSNPHWVGFPAQHKQLMLQARLEVRQVLDVSPGASSQAVVDGLLAAATAFSAQDESAVERALPASVFGLGPQRTAALLRNLPELRTASAAAQYANADTMTNCGFSPNCS